MGGEASESERRSSKSVTCVTVRADLVRLHGLMDFIDGFDDRFDEWAASAGSARLLLLQPLREDLRREVRPSEEQARWAVEPLAWVIERAAVGGVPADEYGTSVEFTAEGNARFGWDPSPVTLDGDRGFGEIDALHLLARDLGAIERAGSRDQVTWAGRVLLANPSRLWEAAAHELVVRGGFFASQCELVLASLLQEDRLDELTAGSRLFSAMIEAAGGEDYLHRIDETGRPRGEAVADFIEIGMYMVRTLATGLRMFEDEPRAGELRPWLNDVGRATVIEALRASLAKGRYVSGMGLPVAGAWN